LHEVSATRHTKPVVWTGREWDNGGGGLEVTIGETI